MNELILARLQFATTSIYHFFFVPLTLGLSILVAILQSCYVKTGNEKYKKLTKYWAKLFLINFAMGVVTGIVQEFQFGMNWSGYSRFVGDIFGAPLAIEALAAFFLESTFLGIWIFGWDKLPKKLHLACIWLVAVASSLSAFWILAANSFMQNPVGYTLNNGRAEMTSFGSLLTNPFVWHQFPHVIAGGLCTGAFFFIGISAINILKKRGESMFKLTLKFGVIACLVTSVLAVGIGHLQGQFLVKERPMKMAAAEAHWETSDPASFVVVGGIDQKNNRNTWEIKIPNLLSFMSYNSFTGEVKGINQVQSEMEQEYGPGNYIPHVPTMFWSFRLMVGAGGLMIVLAILGIIFAYRKTIDRKKWLLRLLFLSLFLPYIANTSGWMMAEIGRQPWTVFGLQKVADGVSKVVSAPSLALTLIGFVVIYGVLAVVDVTLLHKFAVNIPADWNDNAPQPAADKKKEESLWT